MKLNKKIVDRTDRYLRNELTRQELNDFVDQLDKDENFKYQVDQIELIQKGIAYSGLSELLDKTELWDKEVERDEPAYFKVEKRFKTKAMVYLWSAVASIAASLVVVAFVFMQHKRDQLDQIERHFEHQDSAITALQPPRSPDISPLKERAYNLYNTKEYKLAARDLEKVFRIEGDWKSLLYAAIANLGQGKIEKAEAQINRYLGNYPNDDIAQRYLSLITKIKQDFDT